MKRMVAVAGLTGVAETGLEGRLEAALPAAQGGDLEIVDLAVGKVVYGEGIARRRWGR